MDRNSTSSHTDKRRRSSHQITISISARTLWTIAGIALLLIALSLILIKGLHVLLLLYIGIITAEGIRPMIDWLHARHIPRPIGVFATYLAALLAVLGLGWLLVQPLFDQIVGLVSNLPRYGSQAQQIFEEVQKGVGESSLLQQTINAAQGSLAGFAENAIGYIISIPLTVGQLLIDVIVILVVAFFWLTGIENLQPFFVSLFPAHRQRQVQDILSEMGHKTGRYLRGVAIDAIVVGIFSGLAVWLIGAPYPIILGVVAAVAELIPYFGPWISGGIAVLVTLLSGQFIPALLIVVAYVVIQQVEGHVLVPYVMMRTVEINPLTVVFATLLGIALLGIVGGILAVPTASIIHVLVKHLTAPMVHVPTQPQPSAAQPDTHTNTHTNTHDDARGDVGGHRSAGDEHVPKVEAEREIGRTGSP